MEGQVGGVRDNCVHPDPAAVTVRFESGALVVRRPTDNTVRFNSNEGLFHGTDYYNSSSLGAVSLPAYSARTRNSSGTVTFPQLVDTATDGHCRGGRGGNARLRFHENRVARRRLGQCRHRRHLARRLRHADRAWQSLDNRANPTAGDVATFNFYLGCLSLLTFYVSGGRLLLKERIVMRASNPQTTSGTVDLVVTRPAITIGEYRLLAGFFL